MLEVAEVLEAAAAQALVATVEAEDSRETTRMTAGRPAGLVDMTQTAG